MADKGVRYQPERFGAAYEAQPPHGYFNCLPIPVIKTLICARVTLSISQGVKAAAARPGKKGCCSRCEIGQAEKVNHASHAWSVVVPYS
jgi:hypothetical protein